MDNSIEEHEKQSSNFYQLLQSQKTLLLSTVSNQDFPEISYAPYVKDQQGVFYIYVSDLAAHTENLLDNGFASIMFIRNEEQSPNLFARERAIFTCTVSEISKDTECYEKQIEAMKQQLGETVNLLASLPDFHLLALKPVEGRYIAGFGRAFKINMEDYTLSFGSEI